jgi:hypothetical protein
MIFKFTKYNKIWIIVNDFTVVIYLRYFLNYNQKYINYNFDENKRKV